MRKLTTEEAALVERQGPCSCPFWPDHSCPICEEYDTREAYNADLDVMFGRKDDRV